MEQDKITFGQRLKRLFIGEGSNLGDPRVFRRLSLVAFFAWVGLGADGLSSSCYGPQEAFLTLGEHSSLAIFVALGTAVTIMVISASYSQIIELFPGGGGGYLVASRLISPKTGMVSGCALLIDYMLTITISVASGADAIFSSLPVAWAPYKLWAAVAGVVLLTLLNLRGVKESVTTLTPIFLIFVATHGAAIAYALGTHAVLGGELAARISRDVGAAADQLGRMGMFLLVLKAYSMGAGTYTGIEAVSNGLSMLRPPKVRTGKHTMLYIAVSLAVAVVGLMLAYLLYGVGFQEGKTLNAVLFGALTKPWPQPLGQWFVWVSLASEAMILFVAAQTGFMDGPRVLANLALDSWIPHRFALLSDRLVTQNGILLMGASALGLMLASEGSVRLLIVLYSINVFITFALSQAGMVRHWWKMRQKGASWLKGLTLNGLGLVLTVVILASVVVVKFFDGGWLTLVITAGLAVLALKIKGHYGAVFKKIKALDELADPADIPEGQGLRKPDYKAKTAVMLVNGYNGLGLQTLLRVVRLLGHEFKNYVFMQVGVVNAHVMFDHAELGRIKRALGRDMNKYVKLMRSKGFYAEARWTVGTEVVEQILELTPALKERFPNCVFFGGQLMFEKDTLATRILHNQVALSLQRRIYGYGIPFMIIPISI